MAKDHSFDVISTVDYQEVDNAVNQASKEVSQRYDFKDSKSRIDWNKAEKTITLATENDYRLKALSEILKSKCIKRRVSLKALDFGAIESAMTGGTLRQVIRVESGIPTEKAKEIVKSIKNLKRKVQAQIQKEQVRVQAVKIDDLQSVIEFLKKQDFGIDLQFVNYR